MRVVHLTAVGLVLMGARAIANQGTSKTGMRAYGTSYYQITAPADWRYSFTKKTATFNLAAPDNRCSIVLQGVSPLHGETLSMLENKARDSAVAIGKGKQHIVETSRGLIGGRQAWIMLVQVASDGKPYAQGWE